MMWVVRVSACMLLLHQVGADLYLHMPRGSNNRLNEATATRANANRVFDSQNNNRGGYNVGDEGKDKSGNDEGKQYRMQYFQSASATPDVKDKTYLAVEWTNQHGCGGSESTDPQKQNCHMVLQYMCQDDVSSPVGLFTADQKLKTNNGLGFSSAIYTRENPNGNRYGYECPEERDYFPYWHPTPWTDIAILTDNTTLCGQFEEGSFNRKAYGECVEEYGDGSRKHWSRWNNRQKCTENGGQWVEFSSFIEKAPQYTTESQCTSQPERGNRFVWAVPYDATDVNKKECLVQAPPLDCRQADYSRSNHLGNGVNGEANRYQWTLPFFPSNKDKRCVFRMRYNISTDDYAPYSTDSSRNLNNGIEGIASPIEQNPYVDVGGRSALRLNINTDQTGRIFQDRSHVFKLLTRPTAIKSDNIYNINVRGKRGNIVQVYPAVEYDFIPNNLRLSETDSVHIQWTGSNSHNNGGNGGDGQAGDEGQGQGGTDRSNIVQIADLNDNFPMPFERTTMWANANIRWIYHGKTDISPENLAVSMASAGYYRCVKKVDCPETTHNDYIVETKTKMNNLLNNAPASFTGAVLKFRRGTYHYASTRNNNFSNRSQKSTLIVV
ncbi:protein DD3-3-like isoform X2 [Ostrea edulis]|uniref:protein DD3-3-like isoform X2 n=1 Tax=Ostrea edulis TaxID=37623 RepID=UPI002094DA30|nr:protein DD3-3-like isoform X2 [Ostrea edulis]